MNKNISNFMDVCKMYASELEGKKDPSVVFTPGLLYLYHSLCGFFNEAVKYVGQPEKMQTLSLLQATLEGMPEVQMQTLVDLPFAAVLLPLMSSMMIASFNNGAIRGVRTGTINVVDELFKSSNIPDAVKVILQVHFGAKGFKIEWKPEGKRIITPH